MIPRIAIGGASFRGAALYYLRDKDSETHNRVAWTHTENTLTQNPEKAWKVMAYTVREAARLKEAAGQSTTGRKLTKPVFSYSLSWHPEQTPDRDHMLETARRSIAILGLSEHEAIIVAHRDEPQKHVHVIINRVHPITGMAATMSNSKLKLSEFAHAYELENGKIYCPQREDNQQQRKKGKKTMYFDPAIRDAWMRSSNGRDFVTALAAKGYHLARGRSRLVAIDPYGKSTNPLRHLDGVKTKEFNARFQDLDFSKLPEAEALSRAKTEENRRRYDESLRYDKELAEKRERLMERQREERDAVERTQKARLERERNRLQEEYQTQEQSAKIAKLRDKVEHAKWWQRLFGITRRARAALQRLEVGQRHASERIEKCLGQIEADGTNVLSQLTRRQAEDLHQAEERFRALRPRLYVTENERTKLREAFEAGRTRSAPELER